MSILIYIFILGSIILLTYEIEPLLLKKWKGIHKKRVEKSLAKLENAFIFTERKKINFIIFIAPIILGILGWLIFNKVLGLILGAGLGLALPSFTINIIEDRRKKMFSQQLIDGLMVMSSALKGGLSLTQSFEVLAEELPSPIGEEFSLVLREVKIGVTLETALERLAQRMPSEELELFISSILVARETGGDITKVFSRLISTIRERNQLKEKIATYTVQGKLQGIIMSVLPFVFVLWVYKFNPGHFDVMLQSQLGRGLLIGAVVLQILALILIKKFSTIKI